MTDIETIPALRSLFRFDRLHVNDLAISVATIALIIGMFAVVKKLAIFAAPAPI